MSSHQRNHTAVIRWLLFVCLLYSGSSLEAQIEAPTPVPTQEAPSKSNGTSDDSEVKIHNYQLKHAKAAEVLKLFKQLHGGENAVTIDERTNSIVFYLREAAATELLESLALLDSETPHPIIPSTPVLQGSSPQAPVPAKSKPAGPFVKFTFKHAKVADVLKILREVAPSDFDSDDMEGFVVDERTNSFIWKVDTVSLDFEEECKKLDTESPASLGKLKESASPYRPSDDIRSDGVSMSFQTLTISLEVDRSNTVESLKQRYNELEQQTHQLAEKLRQSKSPSEPERTELKTAVRKSFEARQALQRAELADLVQRMKSMQQSVDMRDKVADKVVQRRVEDLLDPNLKWEVTRTSNESTRSISKEDSISSNTITSSQEMQAALQGTWNVRVFQSDNMGDDRVSQVVVRGDLLLVHTIVKEKVLGVSPWKLVWPNAERPYELGVIWDPNSNAESNLAAPARIAYDGKSFQLAWGENADAICPGENITYIDCVRGNIVDRSTATANTEAAADSSLLSDSTPIFNTPQELLDAVEQHGKSGSYEDFVKLFNDGGARDLAGSLLMSAMMQTSIDELSRQQMTGGLSEVDPGTVAVRKVLQRWLPQSLSADQQEYVGKGLSAMMSSIGGTSPDQAALKEFVLSMRKSVEGITDHRKFCFELMQAYEKLTTKPFVYFGNADQNNEWQISQFSDRAIATLIDGSPGMATTITLQQASGNWRISSLFNELVAEAQPIVASPNDTEAVHSNSKMITRRYSVGSFVTESFFTGKGNYDLKEIYDEYETEIEQSLQDLAKTVTAACSQPPKFVQVLSSSRCLLIGHTETGHQEIANFMSDIGSSNDRIRLRGVEIEISRDEAKTLGIELTQHVLSPEEVEKLREFSKSKPPEQENSSDEVSFVAMDDTLASGTQRPLKINGKFPIPVTIAARIVPGSKQIQIRTDMHGLGNAKSQYVAPRFQMLTDGQSVLFAIADDIYWLATADIIGEGTAVPTNVEQPSALSATPSTPATEMQQRLQGEWDVKVMGFNHDDSDKRPYQAVVRGQLFLLQCMEDGKVIGTSPWKMIWPEADHPDVVDIVWDPNNNSDEHFCPGRIVCDGKSFQVAWRSDDSISGPAIRPTEICSGEGISYFECVRKQPADQSSTSTSSDAPVGPKYSGHPLSWWLNSYWDNATANPKTPENETQEYVASEAIRKLRDLPECKAAIEAALDKWFESVEHEVNEIQLVRTARCIVLAAGPEYQELAVAYLFMIWRQLPTLSLDKQIERSGEEIELNDLLKQLVVNDELAIQFAERLTNGTSSDRSFVTYYLFSSTGLKDEKDPKVAELNAWLRNHRDLFIPAFAAALKDESEHVRWFSLSSLTSLDLKYANVLSTLTSVIESDASPKVRWLAVEMLSSKEMLSVAKTQSIELAPLMIKTLESDSSVDVRYAALGALMAMDNDSELVHKTLMEWARCKERLQVEHALSLMLRNHEAGDRPQSIDELTELLSDPEWGTTVEVKQNNYRWARQYAIAILGAYAAHAHRAIPTLEAEVARNNKDTLSFATEALDSVRGYSPDLPIEKLQGEWEYVSMQWPEVSSPFFDFQTSSDQQPSTVITISGTQLKLGDRILAELSHYRSGSRQGVALLLDPDGKKRHCHGGYSFKGGLSPEYKPNVPPGPELLILEVSELLNNRDATQATKQIYEYRRVIAEPKLEAPTP